MRRLPVFRNAHGIIGSCCVMGFGRNDMAKQDTDCSILPARLYRLACSNRFCVDSRTWYNSAEDA
jgi:hypothetical protein